MFMPIYFRRVIVPFAVAALLLAIAPFAHAKAAPKPMVYSGGEIQFQYPKGWIVSDEREVLRVINNELAKNIPKVKTHILLYHQKYNDKKTNSLRAMFLVISDPETTSNGKSLNAEDYVKTSIEGLPTELELKDGKIKKMKMSGMPAIQWGFRGRDLTESRFTTVMKNGVAYSVYLIVQEQGLFDKDKALRDVYVQLQKSFQFTEKAQTYTGGGVTFKVPNGWIVDETQAPQVYNELFVKMKATQRALTALVHSDYVQNAFFLVLSDPDTKDKKSKKVMSAKEYVLASMKASGITPNEKEIKLLKFGGLTVVQWKVSDSSDPKSPRESTLATMIHKNGVAYTLSLEAPYGSFKKDKKLQKAYMDIIKTFKFSTEAKAAPKKKK